jgi:hypothetical protein
LTYPHSEQLDRLLDEIIISHYSAEPRIGLQGELSAALHHRGSDHRRPTSRVALLILAAAAACCIALIIISPSNRRTAPEPADHRQSAGISQPAVVESHSLTSAAAKPVQRADEIKLRTDLHRADLTRPRPPVTDQLPTLAVFPSPAALTPGEQQMLALSRHTSSPFVPATVDDPITIAAIQIEPVQIPLIATQPTP